MDTLSCRLARAEHLRQLPCPDGGRFLHRPPSLHLGCVQALHASLTNDDRRASTRASLPDLCRARSRFARCFIGGDTARRWACGWRACGHAWPRTRRSVAQRPAHYTSGMSGLLHPWRTRRRVHAAVHHEQILGGQRDDAGDQLLLLGLLVPAARSRLTMADEGAVLVGIVVHGVRPVASPLFASVTELDTYSSV